MHLKREMICRAQQGSKVGHIERHLRRIPRNRAAQGYINSWFHGCRIQMAREMGYERQEDSQPDSSLRELAREKTRRSWLLLDAGFVRSRLLWTVPL